MAIAEFKLYVIGAISSAHYQVANALALQLTHQQLKEGPLTDGCERLWRGRNHRPQARAEAAHKQDCRNLLSRNIHTQGFGTRSQYSSMDVSVCSTVCTG